MGWSVSHLGGLTWLLFHIEQTGSPRLGVSTVSLAAMPGMLVSFPKSQIDLTDDKARRYLWSRLLLVWGMASVLCTWAALFGASGSKGSEASGSAFLVAMVGCLGGWLIIFAANYRKIFHG